MKVIDLLNKIANGEEVPKKIKVYDREYEFDEYNTYRNREMLGTLGQHYSLDGMLNDEIEIIEDTPKEDKKIEKVKLVCCYSDLIDRSEFVIEYLAELKNKINEIIDRLNGEE